MDFIDNLANNDIFLTSLIVVLVVLVITFFLVLFLGGKKDKVKNIKTDNEKDDVLPTVDGNDINFNHDEYVKEATLEFELSPVKDIKEELPEVQLDRIEESPAYQLDRNASVDDNGMRNFSFDELSKMISEELNNLDKNDSFEENSELSSENISNENKINEQDSFINAFKEVDSEPKSVETENLINVNPIFKEEDKTALDSVLINKVVEPEKNDEIILPKLADEPKSTNEPVLKDENVPLYARFNQESYDINQKD